MSDLRSQLLLIRTEHGAITPAIVVDVARPEDHPLHSRFEWDDSIAAEAHRRQQARLLIASVVRDVRRPNGQPASIREFHSIRGEDDTDAAYEPLDDIVDDPLMTAILMATMRREWLTLKRRYDRFAEFTRMVLEDLVA